ncbi:MAG: MoaD/ThiS family protein [Pseudomonadales bacterium]
MNVEVRFFASLREAAGVGSMRLALPEAAGFDALLEALAAQLPAQAVAALRAENVRLARNQELLQPPFVLADGDELAFLPPVTGG